MISESTPPLADADAVVIGAGIVGLAVARTLARAGRDVLILEAAETFGTGTSSRNSEVIHAGIYYPKNSLKAELCRAGRDALYRYCAERNVTHSRCGKLIVATDESQIAKLTEIKAKAETNGVNDLTWMEADEVRALEPELHCVKALHSPSSGIIDSHSLMVAYLGEAEDYGAMAAFHAPIVQGRVNDDHILLTVGGTSPMRLRCRTVINAAGLGAQDVAQRLEGFPTHLIPPLYLAKGNYFRLAQRTPFKRLVYPVPEPGGLGVHVTLDLGGQCRFGPDVEWMESINYDVDPRRADRFYAAIRRYWPGLKDNALEPGYAGIRPKLVPAGQSDADFMIQGPRDHGVPGLVNLFGIESPGLTASLALAEMATAHVLEQEPAMAGTA